MPRRTHSPRGRAAAKLRKHEHEVERPMTTDQMARRLVDAGLCSPRVLGPIPTYTHGRDRGRDLREGDTR